MAEPTTEIAPAIAHQPIALPFRDTMDNIDHDEGILSTNDLLDQTQAFVKSFQDKIDSNQKPDTIFFLLKSAIPLARILKTAWPQVYPETPIPNIRYINIGRSKTSEYETMYNHQTDEIAHNFYSPEIQTPTPEVIQEKYGKGINKSGKILLVDEYSESGDTIKTAQGIFEEAFPKAHIETTVVYDQLPHWFKQPGYLGIEDTDTWKNEERALQRVNQRFGTSFESEQDMMGDERAIELRKTFNQYIDDMEKSPYEVASSPAPNPALQLAREEQHNIANEVVRRIREKKAA